MAGGAAGAQGSNTLGTPSTGAATPGMQQPQGSGVGQLAQQGPTGGLGGMLGAVGSLNGQSILGQLGQATAGGQTPPNPFLGQGMPQQSPGFGPGVNNFAPPGSTGPGALPPGATVSPMGQQLNPQRAMMTPDPQKMQELSQMQAAGMPQGIAYQQLANGMPAYQQPLDTSEQAYRTAMASTSFAPGSAGPTYDQWVQQRTQNFQKPLMSPEQMQAANNQKLQAFESLGQPAQNTATFDGKGGVTGSYTPQPQVMPAYPGAQLPPNIQQLLGSPQRGFPQPGMPQKGFPGPRPMPFPQQGGAGARTPLQGLGGLQQLLAQQNPNAYK